MAQLAQHPEINMTDQQIERLIQDLARGRLGTMQEDYQTLKQALRSLKRPFQQTQNKYARVKGY